MSQVQNANIEMNAITNGEARHFVWRLMKQVCYLQNFWLRSLFLPVRKPTFVVKAQDSMTDNQLILFSKDIIY